CAALPAVVADLCRFIRLTGCRPGEASRATRQEFDVSAVPWVWRPSRHKTEHHGKSRVIACGPRARAILERWWAGKEPGATVFGKSDLRREAANVISIRPAAPADDVFTADDLRQRVERAAARVGVPHWCPYQLRHAGLTAMRQTGGLDAAQAQAGHSDPRITERYAAPDVARQAAAVEAAG
ncbi:MAG: tyrosine-type recombinase/integrase, partial [Synechococcus sp.]|nr:tyrosine-type recombinase/integrase [Synechococcus sp.]